MSDRLRQMAAVLAVTVATSSAFAACSRDDRSELVSARPAKVPDGLVPPTVGSDLALYRNGEKTVQDTFANLGADSVVADGQLWELRRGDRLLGALQLATVLPKADLQQAKYRNAIVRQVMAGAVEQFEIGDVSVWSTTSNDKAVYLWFGRHMYVVLSLKGSELNAEAIANEVVEFQAGAPSWEPLRVRDDSTFVNDGYDAG